MMTVKSWLTSWLSWNKYWCTDWGVSNLATFMLLHSLLSTSNFSASSLCFPGNFSVPPLLHSPGNLLFTSFSGNFFYVSPLATSPAFLPHPATLSNSHATHSVQATFLLPLLRHHFSVFINISLFRRSIFSLAFHS